MPRFGVHISIEGGIQNVPERARRPRCETIQMFTRSPRRWASPELTEEAVEAFRAGIEGLGIDPVVIHTIYPINLASPDEELFEGSVELVAEDLRRGARIGAKYVNTHVGHAVGQTPRKALGRVVRAVKEVLRSAEGDAVLLLENAALRGDFHGSRFAELAEIIERVDCDERMGVCLDTAHAFASGYPVHTEQGLEETVAEIDETVGLDRLRVVHLNDSKTEFGCHSDRHEHLGLGKLGREALRRIVNHDRLRHLPFIMETPIDDRRGDKGNLIAARRMVAR